MSFYLETEINLSDEQQKMADEINGANFPWYYSPTTSLKYKMFSHILMRRDPDGLPKEGIINSDAFEFFKNIFLDVCNKNNVDVNVIYRGCINWTWHYPEKHGEIHKDHIFPHNQFIWYLNDFTDAPTYIFDDNENIVKITSVGKNKAAFFSSENHAQGFCKEGEFRKILVFTFN